MARDVAQETEALRAVVREAHEAIKDLTRLLREVRGLKDEVEEVAGKVFAERMEEQVKTGLESYRASITQAIEDATAAVDRRFDTLASIMLREDKGSQRKGLPSIAELVQRKKEAEKQ